MSRLEHVVQVGAALKQTAPTPTAVFPIRELPDELIHKIFDDDVQNLPIDQLCGTLYERCLLVRGSGSCPPGDPIWEAACRRLKLPQAGFGPMGDPASYQTTFRVFCAEMATLPPFLKAMIKQCINGEADLVSYMDRERVRRQEDLDVLPPPMALQLLRHHAILDEYIRFDAVLNGSAQDIAQQLDGQPSRGLKAAIVAIATEFRFLDRATAVLQLLLTLGLNVNSRYDANQTLLQYAITNRAADMVRVLLDHNADVTTRDRFGRTVSEQARAEVMSALVDFSDDEPEYLQTLEVWAMFDPAGATNWVAMHPQYRQEVARRQVHLRNDL